LVGWAAGAAVYGCVPSRPQTRRCLLYRCLLYRCVLYRCLLYRCLLYRCLLYRCVLYRCVLYRCVLYRCVLRRRRPRSWREPAQAAGDRPRKRQRREGLV
jgi:hypothetical protein